MKFLRLTLFHIVFYISAVGVSVGACLLIPFPSRIVIAFVHRWQDFLLFILRTMAGIKYEFRGLENIPSTPCIFAAKHQSMWETLMLHRFMPKGVLLTKYELFLIPFFGWGMKKVGFIPVRRNRRTALLFLLRECRKSIDQGSSLIVFPEGTRKAVGAKVEYKAGVSALYRHLNVPCVPIALNAGKFWPRRSFNRNPGTIEVEILPVIQPGLDHATFMKKLEEVIETKMTELI